MSSVAERSEVTDWLRKAVRSRSERTGLEGSPVSKQFTKGQKSQLSQLTAGTDLYVGIQLNAPGTSWDISCFGLDVNDKLSDDRYFIFYNQPKSPDGSVEQLGAQSGDTDSFRVNLGAVPASIGRFSFCAAIDGAGHGRPRSSPATCASSPAARRWCATRSPAPTSAPSAR